MASMPLVHESSKPTFNKITIEDHGHGFPKYYKTFT